MTHKRARVPGPDHPITIERNPARIVVMVTGRVIADTRDALTLREASYPPVHYVPQKDVDMTALVRSGHTTYCPYKGDCGYYSISIGGARSINAACLPQKSSDQRKRASTSPTHCQEPPNGRG